MVKNPPAIQETEEILVRYLAQEDPLVILAWRMLGKKKPGGLKSIDFQRFGQD